MGALPIQKGSPCSVWLRTEASVAALLPSRAVNSFHPRKQLGIRFLLLSQATVWYTGIQWYAKTALHKSLFQSLTEEIPFISFRRVHMVYYTVLSYNNSRSSDPVSFRNRKKKKIPKNVSKKVPIFFLKLSTWISFFFFPYPSTLYLKLSISVKHLATKLLNLYVKALQGKIWTGA